MCWNDEQVRVTGQRVWGLTGTRQIGAFLGPMYVRVNPIARRSRKAAGQEKEDGQFKGAKDARGYPGDGSRAVPYLKGRRTY